MVHYYCQFFENQSGEKENNSSLSSLGAVTRDFLNQIFSCFKFGEVLVSKQERFKIGLANINFMPTIFKIMQFSFDALLPNSINTLVQIRLKLILNFQYI